MRCLKRCVQLEGGQAGPSADMHIVQVEADYDREDDDEDDDDEAPDLEELDDGTVSQFSVSSRASRLYKPSASGEEPEISREDFDNILDDFLDHYEVVGNRMVPVLEGESGADKLETMRRALVGLDVKGGGAKGATVGGGQEEAAYIRRRYLKEDTEEDDNPDDEVEWPNMPKPKNQWDCETILSGSRQSRMARAAADILAMRSHLLECREPPAHDLDSLSQERRQGQDSSSGAGSARTPTLYRGRRCHGQRQRDRDGG